MRVSSVVVGLVLLASCFDDPPPADTEGASADDDSTVSSGPGDDDATVTGGTPTSSPATTDDDTGEPPGECGPASECVVAPEGWIGPVLVSLAPGEDTPPPCPPASGTEQMLRRAPPPPPAECECSCDLPEGVQCPAASGNVGLTTVAGASCGDPLIDGGLAGTCNDGGAAAWTVVTFGGGPLAGGTGGSCNGTGSETIAPLEISESVRVCGYGVAAQPCGDDGVCAPEIPGVFSFRRCVVREGEHECPNGYDEPHGGFQMAVDDRGCSPCDCGEPISTCTPTLALHQFDGCGSPLYFLAQDECVADVSIESIEVVGTPSGECTPIGGDPTGAFAPQGVTSVCCET